VHSFNGWTNKDYDITLESDVIKMQTRNVKGNLKLIKVYLSTMFNLISNLSDNFSLLDVKDELKNDIRGKYLLGIFNN
jgi:hypothetical protein